MSEIIGSVNVTKVYAAKAKRITWSRYYHRHDSYTCYKIKQRMSPKEVKQIANNSKGIKNVTDIAGILGGAYKGWVGGLIGLYGWNASNQLAPFRAAAKKGKGLQYSYINHSSNITTDSYNTNEKFKQI
ncbi:hypothetical protein ERK18_09160 [Lactobacillus kimbladii]|nr:hypothetical protein [Lactobacillus kimbladii]